MMFSMWAGCGISDRILSLRSRHWHGLAWRRGPLYFLIWQKMRAAWRRPAKAEAGAGPGGDASATAAGVAAGPLVPGSARGCERRVVLVVMLGLDEAATAEVVAQFSDPKSDADHTPVFLTDIDRFEVFSAEGHVFEHMPSKRSRSLAPADLPWERYLHRRLDLLQTKWRPIATIPLGTVARDALTRWRQSRQSPLCAGKFESRSYTDR